MGAELLDAVVRDRSLDGGHLSSVVQLLKGLRVRAVMQALSALIEGALEAAILFLVAHFGVKILEAGDLGVVLPVFGEVSEVVTLCSLLFLILARFMFGSATGYFNSRISTTITFRVRQAFLEQFVASNFREYHRHSDTDIQQLLAVWPQQVGSLMSTLLAHLSNALIMLVMLIIAFSSEPFMSLALIMVIAVMTAVFLPLRKLIAKESAVVMVTQRATADSVHQLSNLRVEGDTFDVTSHLASDCSARFLDEANARFRSMMSKALVAPLYTGLTYLMVASILLVVARLDGLEMASLGPTFLIVLRSLGYGQGLQQAGSTLSTLNPLLETIRDAGARFELSRRRHGNKQLGEVHVVELKDVSFAYEGSTGSKIEKVSLEVRRGDRVGIVGPSGSGKSTLVRLLLGVLEPSSGQVLINGTPLEDLRNSDRCQRITYVPQKVGTLTGAIAENVRFRRESITDEDVSWSLEMSDLAGEVAGFEDGGGTLLANSRDRLSGGQIQRLGIARALAGHPDLVIMDEPTSSVDRASERAIVNSLRSLPTSTTLVLVSHRLELLRDCSTLVVMESGRVTASGRPSDLFSTNEYLRGLEFNA